MYSTVDWKCYSLSKQLRKTFQLCIPQRLISKMVLRAFIFHGYLLFEENINKVTHLNDSSKKPILSELEKTSASLYSWEIC